MVISMASETSTEGTKRLDSMGLVPQSVFLAVGGIRDSIPLAARVFRGNHGRGGEGWRGKGAF